MLFRPRQARDGRKHDLEPRVSMGMFVGSGTRDSDVFIMTARGVVKVTRLPVGHAVTSIGTRNGRN